MQTAARRARRPWWCSRRLMPLFSLTLGGLVLGAMALGGNLGYGLISFGVFAAIAAGLFFFGDRSETLSGLAGSGRDERWRAIDVHATALAGTVVLTVILGAWLWEIAHGGDGSPYGQLSAIGGISYVVFTTVLRRRS